MQLGYQRSMYVCMCVCAHLGTLHGICQVGRRDVPASKDNVLWFDHRQQALEGCEQLLALVVANPQCCSLCQTAKVVGCLQTLLSHPGVATEQHKYLVTGIARKFLGAVQLCTSCAAIVSNWTGAGIAGSCIRLMSCMVQAVCRGNF